MEIKMITLSVLMLFQLMFNSEEALDNNKVFGLDMVKIEQGIKEAQEKEQREKEEQARKEREVQEQKEREEREAREAKQTAKKQATQEEESREASTSSAGGALVGTFRITAYCTEKYAHICGGGQGITASGTKVSAKRTIAVDPSVIPMGSRVFIEGIGERIAEDTGGAINGFVIDLALSTHDEALNFGVQSRQVWILD